MAGRLRVGIVHEIGEVDPHRALEHASGLVLRQVYESLYRRSDGRAVPDLLGLRGLRRSDGGYRAELRTSAKFSDGTPLSAEAVVASLRRCGVLPDDVACSADGDVVVFETAREKAELAELLSNPAAAIVHQVEGPAGPVFLGTGPFAVETWAVDRLHLVRNLHHSGSRPSLDRVEFTCFPSEGDLAHALARGEIDFTSVLAPGELPKGSFVRSTYLPTPSTALMWINVERVPDRRVRAALAHGIDCARLQQLSYPGASGLGASGVVPRALGTFPDSLEYDVEQSRALLREAGVELPLRLSMATIWGSRPYLPSPLAIAAEITEQLAPLGIFVSARAVPDAGSWRDEMIAGDFDLALGGWYADEPSLASFLIALYGSDSIPDGERGLPGCNFGRWRHPSADRLLARIRAGDEAATAELAALVRTEAPVVALHHGAMTVALGARVRGREFDELAFPVFASFTVRDD